jgi:hypothetical protein
MTGLYHKTDNNSVSLEESLCEQHLTIVPWTEFEPCISTTGMRA